MQLLKLKSFRLFLGLLFLAWGICILMSLTSCNPIAIFNPKSYSDKWSNTYVWFKPAALDSLYVSNHLDFNEAVKLPNKDKYLVEWEDLGSSYRLYVENRNEEIDFAWFDGYAAENDHEEIPWIYTGTGILLESDQLLNTDATGYYCISLSNDLKD